MFLLDSNILLEYLLNQEKAIECEMFLQETEDRLTTKNKITEVFEKFLMATFVNGSVSLVSLTISDQFKLLENMNSFNLDFDDAYQLTCANKYNLTLVSFDTDFDRSPVKRKEPKDLLK